MAKRGKKGSQEGVIEGENAGGGSMDFTLTKEHRKAIMAIVINTERHKLDKEALTEDAKGLAAQMGCKPGDVNELVNIMIQERSKGGVIEARERKLDLARQLIEGEDSDPVA